MCQLRQCCSFPRRSRLSSLSNRSLVSYDIPQRMCNILMFFRDDDSLDDLIRSTPSLSSARIKDLISGTTIYMFGSHSEVTTAISTTSSTCRFASTTQFKNSPPTSGIGLETAFEYFREGRTGFIAYGIEGHDGRPFEDLSSLPTSVNRSFFDCVNGSLHSSSFLTSSPSYDEESPLPLLWMSVGLLAFVVLVVFALYWFSRRHSADSNTTTILWWEFNGGCDGCCELDCGSCDCGY